MFVKAAALRYDEYRKSRRYLDFDDILEVLADAFTQDPKLAEKVATRYDEVLIDKGQDLNPLQWKIIDALVPHTRVFMVGDDGQSIYGFRGADFESIHSFTKRVPGGTVLKLEENYRSGQRILDLANWLLAQSPLDYDKHLVGTRGEGEKPLMRHFMSTFEEADWVTNTILEAHNAGDAFGTNKILMRTMSAAREIEASLVEKGIPHVVIGGTSLFALSHTKDLLALVRAGGAGPHPRRGATPHRAWPGASSGAGDDGADVRAAVPGGVAEAQARHEADGQPRRAPQRPERLHRDLHARPDSRHAGVYVR